MHFNRLLESYWYVEYNCRQTFGLPESWSFYKKVAFPLKWNPLKNENFVHSYNIVANHYPSEYLPCSKNPLQAEIFCSDHLKKGVEIFDDPPWSTVLCCPVCVSRFSHVQLFATPWNFPGKNTGVGCHFLPQGIFLTQGSNPGVSDWRQFLYHLSHQGSPLLFLIFKLQNIKLQKKKKKGRVTHSQ